MKGFEVEYIVVVTGECHFENCIFKSEYSGLNLLALSETPEDLQQEVYSFIRF